MCEYCGCQSIDVIAELTDEHDRIRSLGRELALAADGDDLIQARQVARLMRDMLAPHTAVEEDALFPALAAEYPDQLAALATEHADFEASLASLETDTLGWCWPDTARDLVARLFEHILKEQDGVFPAALATLSPAEWEEVARARPGTSAGLVGYGHRSG